MLRAVTHRGDFVFGLDAENVRRLTEGFPIVVSLDELGGKGTVLIVYGETLDDIKQDLEEATGEPLPPATTPDKLRNTQ